MPCDAFINPTYLRIIALLIAFCCTGAARTAQRSYGDAQKTLHTAPLEKVIEPEVFVPKVPTVFRANGRSYLCYELLITNMESSPFRLARIDVYGDDTNAVLYEQTAKELNRSLKHPGWNESKSLVRDAQVIRGGERAVEFLWVEIPFNMPSPKSLSHTVTVQRLTSESVITLPIAGKTRVENQAITISPPLREMIGPL